MRFQRRQLLRTLSFAFGSSFIWNRNQLGIAAQTSIQPKVSPPPVGAAVRDGIAEGTEMGNSDRNRRILLSSQRSESAGALVQATPGDFADTNVAHRVESTCSSCDASCEVQPLAVNSLS
jgi:hypothetical protein